MKAWLWILSGPIVWTVHFFGAYIIASVFPGAELADWLVALLTIFCLGAAGLLLFRATRRRGQADAVDRWITALAAMGQALAIIAVAYQGLPALLA